MPVLHLDIETYSDLDLPEVGLYRYASDPSTEILMLGWAIDDGPVELLDPIPSTMPRSWPVRLIQALRDPTTIVCAFNAQFERVMLRDCLKIDIPIERWHCTMVHGFALGFSGGLGAQAQAVGVDQQKMEEGRKLIQRFSKPQPDNRKVRRWTRDNDPENWALFGAYCRQDVETERALQEFYDQYPLPDQVWADWELDQLINDRGLPVDRRLVDQALLYADETRKSLLDEIYDLTGLQNPNSNTQLLAWLQDHGLDIDNLQAATVARKLKSKSTGPLCRRVLELKQQLAKSSVSKFDAFAAATDRDDRIRGTLQYLGASRTGRWGGRLIQPQNFPRPPKGIDVANVIAAILTGRPIDNPLHSLSAALRGVFKAGKGKTLVVADLAGIEGRVLPWLCGFDEKLKKIEDGLDMYKVAAAGIYRINYEAVSDEQRTVGKVCIAENQLVLTDQGLVPIQYVTRAMRVWDGKEWVTHDGVVDNGLQEVIEHDGLIATRDHIVWTADGQTLSFETCARQQILLLQTGADERPIRAMENNISARTTRVYDIINAGPRHRFTVSNVLVSNCELALGYQGSVNALNTMANAYGLPPYTEQDGYPIVQAWRMANKPITQFWSACQRAARLAIRNRNITYTAGKLVFIADANFLMMILPSGRTLYYYQPMQDENSISYMGLNQYTRKWERTDTYGGKFAENATQAVSRDILVHGMRLVEDYGFQIVGHVHDEIITEQRPAKKRSAAVLSNLMSTRPSWAPDLPLAAQGFEADRYRK